MPRQNISTRAWSAATPATVYALLREGATWPTWSPIDAFELREEGDGGGEGLGAIRVFHTGRHHSVERIVSLEPDRRLSYALVKGLPIRNYRADVDLSERDGGTEIHWHSAFDAKLPGTGPIIRRALGRFIQECVDGLAAYASKPSEASTSKPS